LSGQVGIRAAEQTDVALLLSMIAELAEYERAANHVTGTEELLVLLSHLAGLAVKRGCVRLDWAVLDWNSPAIAFCERLGASPLDQWKGVRLTGQDLLRLAGGPDRLL
jgi:hypothetical protein